MKLIGIFFRLFGFFTAAAAGLLMLALAILSWGSTHGLESWEKKSAVVVSSAVSKTKHVKGASYCPDISVSYDISGSHLLASLVLAVVGIAVAPAPLTGVADSLAKVVMLGLFPVGGAFVLRYQHLTQDTTPREVQKWGYGGCPPWMRYTCYGLMIAGLVLFFMPAFLESVDSTPKGGGSEFPSTVPGGFGLLAYSAFFGQLYSLKVLANQSLQGTRRQAARP